MARTDPSGSGVSRWAERGTYTHRFGRPEHVALLRDPGADHGAEHGLGLATASETPGAGTLASTGASVGGLTFAAVLLLGGGTALAVRRRNGRHS